VTVVVTFFESSPLFFVRTVSSNEKLSTTPLTETLCPDSNTSPVADKSAPATLTAPAADPTSRAPPADTLDNRLVSLVWLETVVFRPARLSRLADPVSTADAIVTPFVPRRAATIRRLRHAERKLGGGTHK
jgi:hypothetical protein